MFVRSIVARSSLGAVALALALLLPSGLAHAATFTVNNVSDAPDAAPGSGGCATAAGACTLRAAIQEANAVSGPHTIELGVAGTYTLTVAGAGENAAATGDLDINGQAVTIVNTSGGPIVIDGNATDRIFDVGPTSLAQLTISNVTLRNGNSGSGANGGAIQVDLNSGLTLDTVILTGNTAGARGGAIGFVGTTAPSGSGSLTLTNVTITGNTSGTEAGGLFNSRTAVLRNVTFLNNRAQGDRGGGIASSGNLTVTDSTFSGNTSTLGGGASLAGVATLTNVTFTGNSAPAGGGLAGAGNVTLVNATFTGNQALSAGGGIANGGVINMRNSTVRNNSANTSGGGIASATQGAVTATVILNNVVVSGNRLTNTTQAERGGGLAIGGRLVANNLLVSDNLNPAGVGGGLIISANTDVTLTDVQFIANQARLGGGLANDVSPLRITRAVFARNLANDFGGAMANMGPATLTDVVVRENQSVVFDGGIANDRLGNMTISNSLFLGNTADGNGAIGNVGTMTLTNVTVTQNRGRRVRGGLTNVGTANLINVTFASNSGADGANLWNAPPGPVEGNQGSGPGTINMRASIISDPLEGANCFGTPIVSGGDNIVSGSSCNLSGPNDRNTTDPQLNPLADNGGFSPTLAPRPGSPAIDGVLSGCPPPPTDQRGARRPFDGDGNGSALCDVGAVEVGVAAPPVVPELSTVLMFGSGLAGLGSYALARARARRRRPVAA